MLDKNDDRFFDEPGSEDEKTDQLLKMIDTMDKKIRTDIKTGVKITGKVTRIGPRFVFVDIGAKNEAMIKADELKDDDGVLSVKVGDSVSAFVISDTAEETVLSKSLGGHNAAISELMEAMNGGVPVQGKVTGINKGGINVKVMGYRAFCPASQIEIKYVEDLNSYLNKTLSFVISRITENGRNIVLSRIPLLERDLESKIDALIGAAADRTIYKGTISKIADFGLFIDMGGLEGLVHISEVSWERAEKLSENFTVGQRVEYVVLKIEKKQPLRNSKISLSIKQVLDDPWKSVRQRFAVGQSIEGTVRRITGFGAFVEIAPGVEGLVHVSEMSWVKRVHHPSEIVSEGSPVRVTVLAIDEDKKTISLSLKDITNDPWRDAQTRFAPGSEVAGKVAKKARYGFFIDLAEGITGLLPFANIVAEKKTTVKEGDTVTVHIESIDLDQRRLSLSLGLKEAGKEAVATREYIVKQDTRPSSSSSTEFGAALQEALKRKRNN